MSRRDSLLFGLALVAFVSLGLPDAVIGVAWPSMRRSFELPLDRLGVLLFAASIGYLAASFLNGPVTRRYGVGGVLLGSSALVVLSAAAFAAAPSFLLLLLAAVFAGTGGGAIDAARSTCSGRPMQIAAGKSVVDLRKALSVPRRSTMRRAAWVLFRRSTRWNEALGPTSGSLVNRTAAVA